ncbi:MAG: hypothetical protein IT581_12225 [Verrucomicrobiales bacterium]|nr:hypothetical protein [Verrucomicrobiales bacterium]
MIPGGLRPHSQKLADLLEEAGRSEMVLKKGTLTMADTGVRSWFSPANLVEAMAALGGEIRMRKDPRGWVSVVVTTGGEG